jgi:glycosyltransferase domain-containing protein
MPRLVIPTRNRPTSIARVLEYVARFYRGAELLVADGSERSYSAAYATAIGQVQDRLKIDYRVYGPGPTLSERMIDALSSVDDELVIVGADDDYPVLDVLERAAAFLNANPDYVIAIGGIIGLRLFDNGDVQAKLLHARSVEQASSIARINRFVEWPYATSYGVVRREHYIERYRNAELGGFPGFGDYTVGIHDCVAGKIKALDEICYFTTTNPAHSKLRRRSSLFYLERAPEVLAMKDHYKEVLTQQPGVTEERAEQIAVRLINTRIAEMVTPAPQNRPGFGRSELFKDPVVARLYAQFQALFEEGSALRERLLPQVRHVVSAMHQVAMSKTDNRDEPAIYDSLQDMESGGNEREMLA